MSSTAPGDPFLVELAGFAARAHSDSEVDIPDRRASHSDVDKVASSITGLLVTTGFEAGYKAGLLLPAPAGYVAGTI